MISKKDDFLDFCSIHKEVQSQLIFYKKINSLIRYKFDYGRGKIKYGS